jgi:lipopolysaccharide/colanic/teichoic acid biosynthesis glycosyltransferase
MMENKISILYIGDASESINQLGSHSNIVLSAHSNLQSAETHLKNSQKPDAILCEQVLSGGNGIDLHDKIRRDPAFNEVSFILLSHEFREDLIRTAFSSRIDDFFVLPLPPTESLMGRLVFLQEYRQKYPVSGPETHVDINYTMPWTKRLFDILVASAALILLSPLLLIVIIAIRLESKGKVYYISKRMGRGMAVFDFYKLRSMRTGADAELSKLARDKNQYATAAKVSEIDFTKPCPRCSERTDGTTCSTIRYIGSHQICDYWYSAQLAEVAKSKSKFVKISNDPRVTKVGKFIRNTSIDELPQLINVIKGDMSIVGNRPLPVYEGIQLTIDHTLKRFGAPAGITGLWQVELRGKGGVMSESEREALDNEYTDHFSGNRYSFFYDLKLILRTAKALFQKDSV